MENQISCRRYDLKNYRHCIVFYEDWGGNSPYSISAYCASSAVSLLCWRCYSSPSYESPAFQSPILGDIRHDGSQRSPTLAILILNLRNSAQTSLPSVSRQAYDLNNSVR